MMVDHSGLRIPQHKIDELAGRVSERDVLQMVTSDCALCGRALVKSRGVWVDDTGGHAEFCHHLVTPGSDQVKYQLHVARCDLPDRTDRAAIEAWLDDA